jgi:hypothetical protein
MSYRHSWSRQFYPDEYYVEGELAYAHPIVCPDHKDDAGRSICFRIGGGIQGYIGTWYMNTPILVSDVMPGTKVKILKAYTKAKAAPGGFPSSWSRVHNKLALLLADRTKLWESGELYIPEGEWGVNAFDVNKTLNLSDIFMVSLFQGVTIWFGGWVGHVAEVRLDGEYYNDIPPETASVKITITNRQTGALVSKAYVALMSGAVVVASGYADGGVVTFENIDEGSYTIKVQAGGYNDLEQSIEVKSPSVWYVVKIVPIPVTHIPTWVYWAVGGVAALGAITVIPSVIRRKPEEKIIVVR